MVYGLILKNPIPREGIETAIQHKPTADEYLLLKNPIPREGIETN